MTAGSGDGKEAYSKAYVVVMKQPYGCHGGPPFPAFEDKEEARDWARAARRSLKEAGQPTTSIGIAAVKIYEGRPTFLILGGSPCFYGGVAGNAVRSFPSAAAALAYGLERKVKNPRALFVEIAGPAGSTSPGGAGGRPPAAENPYAAMAREARALSRVKRPAIPLLALVGA